MVPFKLADIGEGISEVELMKWYVAKGDKIKAFDKLCEVQSDKATTDITSPFDGIIENVLHKEGDIVKVILRLQWSHFSNNTYRLVQLSLISLLVQ